MAGRVLHIYAVNERIEGTHTYLSRSQGQAATLPDLAGWLGLRQGGLNTDEIELFATSDLAGMALTDYVTTAFELEASPDAQTSARLNALDGHVLLIPEAALSGAVSPKSQLTLVSSLRVARPDHSAEALEPAPLRPAREERPTDPEPVAGSRTLSKVWMIGVAGIVLALLAYLMVG